MTNIDFQPHADDLAALLAAINRGATVPQEPGRANPVSREETRIFSHLAALCSRGEYCEGDIMRKLRRWLLDDEARQRILARLRDERYVDDARYCRAYVHDKTTQNDWGPIKIRQTLTLKGVSRELIEANLALVGEEQWAASLSKVLAAKRRTLGSAEPSELRHKLLRFAASRGFTASQALAAVGTAGEQ